MRKLFICLALLCSLQAETRAYWWHQPVAPPLQSSIVAGAPVEFIAVLATDNAPGVIGFAFTIQYSVDGVARVEERWEPARLRTPAGVSGSVVFEVKNAKDVSATARALMAGPAAKAEGAYGKN